MRIEYTKWDGRLHWHFEVDELGTDDHGLWLGARRGCRLQRGDEPSIDAPHEFIEHRDVFGYPEDVATKAEATAAELLELVRTRVKPFDRTPATWLARVR